MTRHWLKNKRETPVDMIDLISRQGKSRVIGTLLLICRDSKESNIGTMIGVVLLTNATAAMTATIVLHCR